MDKIGGFTTAGPHVVLDGVHGPLMEFAALMDEVHQLLFTTPLVITSARDGAHAPGSLHTAGMALDVRTDDKKDDDNLLFLALLSYACKVHKVTIFDERNLPGAPHIHIEWHGASP